MLRWFNKFGWQLLACDDERLILNIFGGMTIDTTVLHFTQNAPLNFHNLLLITRLLTNTPIVI